MRFHISTFGRFHSFQLAEELSSLGHEVVLSTGYPVLDTPALINRTRHTPC